MSNPYRVYFDVCCLNRPFDDSSQDRIRLEAEAVLSIYRKCRLGEWALLTSEVIESELRQTPDTQRVELIMAALAIATEKAPLDSALKQRAVENPVIWLLNLTPYEGDNTDDDTPRT